MSEGIIAFFDGDFMYHITKDTGIKIKYDKMIYKMEKDFNPFLRAYYYAGVQKSEYETTIKFRDFLRYNKLSVVECPIIHSNEEEKQDRNTISLKMSIDIVGKPLSMQKQNIVEIVIATNNTDAIQAIRFIKECGVKVNLLCDKTNTSSELKKATDTYTDIFEFLGKNCVEKT